MNARFEGRKWLSIYLPYGMSDWVEKSLTI